MNCAAIQEKLSPYIDGELGRFETVQVENHLRCCTHCVEELQFLRSTVALLADLDEVEVPDSFRPALRARLEGLPATVVAAAIQRKRASLSLWRRWGMPAAAAVAAISTFLFTYRPASFPVVDWHGPEVMAPPAITYLLPELFSGPRIRPELPAPVSPGREPAAGAGAVNPGGQAPAPTAEPGEPKPPDPVQTPPPQVGPPQVADAGGTGVPQPALTGIQPAQTATVGPGVASAAPVTGELYHVQYSLLLAVTDADAAVARLQQVAAAVSGKVVGQRIVEVGGRAATEVTLEVPANAGEEATAALEAIGRPDQATVQQQFDKSAEWAAKQAEQVLLQDQIADLEAQLQDSNTAGNLRVVLESDLKRIQQQVATLQQELDLLRQSARTATIVVTLQTS